MKTLKEAMADTIEMYEFISQLKSENDGLRCYKAVRVWK